MKQAQELIDGMSGLFAGGSLSEQDKDAVMKALQDIYWESKPVMWKIHAEKIQENRRRHQYLILSVLLYGGLDRIELATRNIKG